MSKKNHLAENLKAYRLERNMSMTEFSEELGISKTTLQSVMKGGNTTVDTLVRMSNALGMSLDDLVYGCETKDEIGGEKRIMKNVLWFCQQTTDVQQQLCVYLERITELLEGENDQRIT